MASHMALLVKNMPANAGDIRRHGFDAWVEKIPWKRAQQPTPVFLPGESHEQRNLVGYSPWGCKKSDKTEQLSIQYCKKRKRLLELKSELGSTSNSTVSSVIWAS